MQAFGVFSCISLVTATDDRPMPTQPKQRTAVMMPAPFEPSLSPSKKLVVASTLIKYEEWPGSSEHGQFKVDRFYLSCPALQL